MRTDKRRSMITRETILQVLDRTDDNIKQGLTIDDVLPFFVKYKLRLRVFNVFHKRIFRYCLLYTSPSPRDRQKSRMPSSA